MGIPDHLSLEQVREELRKALTPSELAIVGQAAAVAILAGDMKIVTVPGGVAVLVPTEHIWP